MDVRIIIPNTKHLKGKWGDLKVSGSIDNYKFECKNIAPKKGYDKLLSINSEIRQAIGKDACHMVTVTLHLIPEEKSVNKKHIIECFKDADVFTKFKSLQQKEQAEIIQSVLVLPFVKQVEKVLYFINKLS
ncbi:MAG TPA: DUF1905 domain-containing protein [Segetibacter sp.]